MVICPNAPNLILSPIRLLFCNFHNLSKTLFPFAKMSWTCSRCTYINPPSQKSSCQICLSAHTPSLLPSPSSAMAAPRSQSESKWACTSCTFLNPYRAALCEMCGTRASAALMSALEVDFNDPDEARLGSSVGSVFFPLRNCCNREKVSGGNQPGVGVDESACSGKFKGVASPGDSDSRDTCGLSKVLVPCSNKRKNGEGGCAANPVALKAIEVESLDNFETHEQSLPKTFKFLSYNIWFREDLEMHNRMKALGNLIRLHSPDVICFQEVTPAFYDIFQRTNWWKEYQCSISDKAEISCAYFCMQLSKLPVKSYTSHPFQNSIMGRELCIAEVNAQPDLAITVATSHLESPCPSPPTWNQMFSKERVEQANDAVRLLDKNRNVIFGGDMNWDDKLDGPFPLPDGWVDGWTELRPSEAGWTYDTKSNEMLAGNRTLQKRLDRVVCKLKDFKISEIEMIGKDAIPGLSYMKEKRVKGQVKELELPVLPSDHYGLLLTISPDCSSSR